MKSLFGQANKGLGKLKGFIFGSQEETSPPTQEQQSEKQTQEQVQKIPQKKESQIQSSKKDDSKNNTIIKSSKGQFDFSEEDDEEDTKQKKSQTESDSHNINFEYSEPEEDYWKIAHRLYLKNSMVDIEPLPYVPFIKVKKNDNILSLIGFGKKNQIKEIKYFAVFDEHFIYMINMTTKDNNQNNFFKKIGNHYDLTKVSNIEIRDDEILEGKKVIKLVFLLDNDSNNFKTIEKELHFEKNDAKKFFEILKFYLKKYDVPLITKDETKTKEDSNEEKEDEDEEEEEDDDEEEKEEKDDKDNKENKDDKINNNDRDVNDKIEENKNEKREVKEEHQPFDGEDKDNKNEENNPDNNKKDKKDENVQDKDKENIKNEENKVEEKKEEKKEEIKEENKKENNFSLQNNTKIIKDEFYLNDINLTVKQGEFICIIGDVGSGKSSLIQAILNNMIIEQNPNTKIIVNGKISYVGQEAWIQNNTIQKNILFYRPYDTAKYHNILNLCELNQDLDSFPGGDLTEIGEKGVNLSGGQKARISLARAMYCDNDIYILDDPISALDAHVGKNIMNNCILGYLKGKTIILATHALQYAAFADRIYYMKNGEINWQGPYQELIQQKFYSQFAEKINNKLKEDKEKEKNKDINDDDMNNLKLNQFNVNKGTIKRITKDEGKESGKINKKVFYNYYTYIGGSYFCLALLTILFSWQGLKIMSDLWLGYWSEHQGERSNTFFFAIYSITALGGSLFNYLRTRIITSGSINCSTKLHNQMITSLVRAPINLFHDTVPKGQIFNRLSKDLPTVDTYTMYWFMTLTAFGSSFLGAIIVCSLYEKECLLFLPFFIILCWFLYRFYINCSRELNRIEGVLNSPVLNLVNETIPGTATIRAYNLQNKYIEIFQDKVDEHYKLLYYINGTGQWYLLYLNLLSILFLTYMVIMTLLHKNKFTPKIIGIILTYSLILQEDVIEFLSSFSNFENTMTKMERCLSYTHLISERPNSLTSDLSLRDWPTKGEIQFKNFNVKYRSDTELVLKNINFHLRGGEHLGIVGRTGSGKSTISLCLFRILEAFSGEIFIDGVDISKVGLTKLRESITIIPQDSTLMDGTLRYNIDPIKMFTDKEIIQVMKKIGFDYIIKQHKSGLDQNISENGSNLSIGEKQLICITRAILRKTKIIVLDEATASIDYKTEEIIQKALNEILVNSTMICIAHRIKTVINADKILVLENGEIVEFDTPQNLLNNKNSLFYDFYSKSLL